MCSKCQVACKLFDASVAIIYSWNAVSTPNCFVGLQQNEAQFLLSLVFVTFRWQLLSRRALPYRFGTLFRSPCATNPTVRLQGPYHCRVRRLWAYPSDGAYRNEGRVPFSGICSQRLPHGGRRRPWHSCLPMAFSRICSSCAIHLLLQKQINVFHLNVYGVYRSYLFETQ